MVGGDLPASPGGWCQSCGSPRGNSVPDPEAGKVRKKRRDPWPHPRPLISRLLEAPDQSRRSLRHCPGDSARMAKANRLMSDLTSEWASVNASRSIDFRSAPNKISRHIGGGESQASALRMNGGARSCLSAGGTDPGAGSVASGIRVSDKQSKPRLRVNKRALFARRHSPDRLSSAPFAQWKNVGLP